MEKLGWSCLLLFSLFGQLWSIPRTSDELPAWSPVNNEDAKFNLEPLSSRRSFQQTLTRRLGVKREHNPIEAAQSLFFRMVSREKQLGTKEEIPNGLDPSRFSAREYVKEAPIGSFSRDMLLRRLWESARKQYKKRRNLSQCFWKYCV